MAAASRKMALPERGGDKTELIIPAPLPQANGQRTRESVCALVEVSLDAHPDIKLYHERTPNDSQSDHCEHRPQAPTKCPLDPKWLMSHQPFPMAFRWLSDAGPSNPRSFEGPGPSFPMPFRCLSDVGPAICILLPVSHNSELDLAVRTR